MTEGNEHAGISCLTHEAFAVQILKPISMKLSILELDVLRAVLKCVIVRTKYDTPGNKATVWMAYKLLARIEGRRFTTKKEISLSMNIAEAAAVVDGLNRFPGLHPMVASIYLKIGNQI